MPLKFIIIVVKYDSTYEQRWVITLHNDKQHISRATAVFSILIVGGIRLLCCRSFRSFRPFRIVLLLLLLLVHWSLMTEEVNKAGLERIYSILQEVL
jgi:hypothetical protein